MTTTLGGGWHPSGIKKLSQGSLYLLHLLPRIIMALSGAPGLGTLSPHRKAVTLLRVPFPLAPGTGSDPLPYSLPSTHHSQLSPVSAPVSNV